MKLTDTVEGSVEISGSVSAPQDFKIKASREAFKILSSGLYNNKILAIVRELSCNAYDAHVAAGKKTEPFEVHLPTRLEPHFSVKDNGVGLSHEEVLSLYTTYFATDKTQSNEFVGALGLGSKSPFCYTEGFTVASRFMGVLRIYACFINDSGTPTVLLQSEEPNSEQNGLEVSFPVNVNDIWTFENQAKAALEFFDPLPLINTEIEVDKKDYTFKTSTWGLRKPDGGYNQSPRAVQGMVPYSIGTIDRSRLTTNQAHLMDLPIDIFFNIGDLSVAASRESLSNDERTITNILNALDAIDRTFVQQVKDKLKECKSLWEGKLLIYNMINTPGIGKVISSAFNKGELDGDYGLYSFVKGDIEIKESDYPEVEIYRFSKSWRLQNAEKRLISSPLKTRLLTKDTKVPFRPSPTEMFVINDLGFGVEKYVHYFLQTDNNSETGKVTLVYLINRVEKTTPNTCVVKQGLKIISALGNPPYKLISDLKRKYEPILNAEKPATVTVKREYITFDLQADVSHVRSTRDGGRYEVQGWRDGWKEAPAPKDQKKFYVKVKNLAPTSGAFEHAEEFQAFLKAAYVSGKFDLDEHFVVYGLQDNAPQLKESGWIEFTSYVFDKLVKYMTPAKELGLSLYLKPFNPDHRITELLVELADDKPLSSESIIQKFAIDLDNAKVGSEKKALLLMRVVSKAKALGLYEIKNSVDFNQIWKGVVNQYPLVNLLKSYYSGGEFNVVDEVIRYIKLVDKEIAETKVNILSEGEKDENVTSIQ